MGPSSPMSSGFTPTSEATLRGRAWCRRPDLSAAFLRRHGLTHRHERPREFYRLEDRVRFPKPRTFQHASLFPVQAGGYEEPWRSQGLDGQRMESLLPE